ncbi:MAG: sn-glycerol-3-phosphate ABC transporter ATP-binding protein UgpC [Clostridia bacterium]|nr:sn-glycerol-3-phosphate ABC transporter ATP-binding protein UgpC [Clostridia bacterium]
MASLSLKGIYKKYPGGVIAVSDFNLEIKDKEFIIFVGPSGCGKSTTLRMIAGLEEISDGELYIGDRLVNDVAPKDRDIAMVFQNYALYPHMSVFENMAFGLKLRKTPKDEIKRRVDEAARILDIAHLLDRKPKALSGGQRQRVALGRAIVREPQVFLLDEPLSNLDAKLRAQMRTELTKLHQRLGTTFIYVTHDQTEAMTMADRICVMKDGFIQQVDTPQHLYDMPCNMFVAGFIGTPQMNFVDSKIIKKGDDFYVEFGSEDTKRREGVKFQIKLPESKNPKGILEQYVDKEVIMGIRPEHIHDEPKLIEEFPDGVVEANVEVTELMGAETYLYLNCETHNLIARVDPSTTAKTGDTIKITMEPGKIHLFDKDTEQAIAH